jgi:hypothetical protein
VTLHSCDATLGASFEEGLFRLVDVAVLSQELAMNRMQGWSDCAYLDNSEADIHPRAYGLVRNDPVDLGIRLKGFVNLASFPFRNNLLSVDLVREVIEKLFQDLARNVYTRRS